MISNVASLLVLSRDRAKESESGSIVHARRIPRQVFREQFNTHGTHRTRIAERHVHLAVSEQRMLMQVARADSRPLIVDEHQLVVHVDKTARSIRAEARNSRESEVL